MSPNGFNIEALAITVPATSGAADNEEEMPAVAANAINTRLKYFLTNMST
jgi:hypothetical protein